MSLRILFEDEWLLALDKPAGVACHAGAGVDPATTLEAQVRRHLGPRAVRNDFTASLAHRLDRGTSGVVLAAKRRPAMVALTKAFEQGLVKKRYLALVQGKTAPAWRCDVALGPTEGDSPGPVKTAATRFETVAVGNDLSLVAALPETGRKHQIRRHLQLGGHPIVGDDRYGVPASHRMFLHAASLTFPHPRDGTVTTIAAPIPEELVAVLRAAGIAAIP